MKRNRMSRREFVRYVAMASGILVGGSLWQVRRGKVIAGPAGTGGTLIVGVVADPVNLDPAQSLSHSDDKIAVNMFNSLVKQEVGSYRVLPDLAERWVISPDGKSYTFYLRKGVRFHDGTSFNADAARFSIDRQIDENNPLHKMGTFPYRKSRLGLIENMETGDDSTLKINLKEPFNPFIDYLASYIAPMISPAAARQLNTTFGERPVGTGPYKFGQWVKGQRLILERNSDYWGGIPRLDRIIGVTYPEGVARVSALLTGTAQLIEGVPPDNVEQLKNDPSVQIISAPGPGDWYVVLNTKFKPLGDIRVRQALNHAVDKDSLVRNVLRGLAAVSNGPLSPVFAEYQTTLPTYPYDPGKARQLLTEAGYPNGFEVTFSVPTSGTGMLEPVPMATFIQANLARVGIKAQIKTFEWGAYQKVRIAGDFQMAALSWTPGIGNPDIILYAKFHSSQLAPNGYNNSFWTDPKLDALLNDARTTRDKNVQIQDYKEAQRIIVAGASHIWVCHPLNMVAASSKLHGFKVHPTTVLYFPPNVWLG